MSVAADVAFLGAAALAALTAIQSRGLLQSSDAAGFDL
jgi:hypothetical protein